MTKRPRNEDREQRPRPLPDFYGEDRHELVQNLAYQHWEKRGVRLAHRKLIGSQLKGRARVPVGFRNSARAGQELVLLTGLASKLERRAFHNVEI